MYLLHVSTPDPAGQPVPVQMTRHRDLVLVTFVPQLVGGHSVTVTCGGRPGRGSPVTCHVYDVSRVKAYDVTEAATVGEEIGFKGRYIQSNLL